VRFRKGKNPMEIHSRKLGITLLWIVSLMFLPAAAGVAQEAGIARFPGRPITLIVPMPPGGGTDLAVRLIAKEAEKFLGQSVVVLNKPGGSQTIAGAAVANAKPDGYTLGYTSHLGLFMGPLMEKVPYHPVKDLKQIMQFGCTNIAVTVKGDSPFKRFEDGVDYARQNPKKLTYGSAGTGTLGNMVMDQIAKKEKVQFTHIPFKGSPETQAALLGGHILVGTGDFNYSLIEAGQIRLVLLIVENHSTDYPQTPILKDLGYDIPCATPMTIACPKSVPNEIVKKLEDAFTRAIKEPGFVKGMRELRYTIVYRNSKDLEEYVSFSYDAYAKLLKEIGLAK
jgi:tripartite-type tricarboxylate transporter receptor subunit TctC